MKQPDTGVVIMIVVYCRPLRVLAVSITCHLCLSSVTMTAVLICRPVQSVMYLSVSSQFVVSDSASD